ncbi:prephenate dehydrogenase/arogenate dehydrogenase family protein [Pyrococcus kukulkanii]|uniref:prephenate dehydrogenase/arogenate dehydrogenase family protein n=1 Tax=Pyrococcus kukulkanii TaxID=1609559 RepID=UPI003568D682
MRIGVSGYGKMGRTFARILRKKHEVKVYSNYSKRDFSNLKELYEWSDVIILATSMEKIRDQLQELKKIAQENPKDAVLFDIATFKSEIIGLYVDFPKSVKVASVHPMFGPGVTSFEGEKFIIVPVPGREDDSRMVADLIRKFGGNASFLLAEKHDYIMGYVIGVPYALGLAYLRLSLKRGLDEFGGTSHEYLITYGKAVLNDSPEFIREVLKNSWKQIVEFLGMVLSVNPGQLKEEVGKEEIEEAYKRFYECLKGRKAL